MARQGVLEAHEGRLYRRATSDGMIDLFFGAYLLVLGAVWIWLPQFTGLAIAVPAALVPVMILARQRFVENRLGYVKWAEPRREAERRDRIGLLTAGVALFLVATAVFAFADRSAPATGVLEAIAPGIMAWLLAVLALALAYVMRVWRFLVYGSVLVVAGGISALQVSDPGWSMLAGGLVAAATGLGMLIRFLRENPAPGHE